MECILLALFVILVIALLLGFGMGGGRRGTRALAAFEHLAQQRHGTLYRAGWFGDPRVTFRYRSASALVGVFPFGIQPNESKPVTQLQIEWPDAHLQLLVIYPPRISRLTATDGLYEWKTRRPGFDSLYSIRTSDPATMPGLLTDSVQQLVDRLRCRPQVGALMIEVQRGVFRVSKAGVMCRPHELQEFVETALQLYDFAMLGGSEGIEFLNDQSAQLLEDVVCTVCGEEIHDDLVFCRRCKTPHHRDCWLYAGRCSVFACGETQFDTPRQPPRVTRGSSPRAVQPGEPAGDQTQGPH